MLTYFLLCAANHSSSMDGCCLKCEQRLSCCEVQKLSATQCLLVLLVFLLLLTFALYGPILMHCIHYVCVGLMCVDGIRLSFFFFNAIGKDKFPFYVNLIDNKVVWDSRVKKMECLEVNFKMSWFTRKNPTQLQCLHNWLFTYFCLHYYCLDIYTFDSIHT